MVLKTSTVLTYPPCTWVNFFYVDPTDSNFVRQTWFYRSKVVYFDGYRFAFDLLQKAISHTGFLRDLPRWKWWSLCSWKLIHHHCADAQNTTRWNKSWVLLTNQIWIFAPKSTARIKIKCQNKKVVKTSGVTFRIK